MKNLASIVAHYDLHVLSIDPLTGGHINQTYIVHTPDASYVLQQVNAIFKPEVHDDMHALTHHLQAHGLLTPQLLKTRDNKLWIAHLDQIWRVQTYIPGMVYQQATQPQLCYQAGLLLGKFHAALHDVQHTFAQNRQGVHDTAAHFDKLVETLGTHKKHPAYDTCAYLADTIFSLVPNAHVLHTLPLRIVHGDPKLNNIIFSADGHAIAMIDLDTLAYMSLPLELGDAFRSWCNIATEDSPDSLFSLAHFKAAIEGYMQVCKSSWLSDAEREALPFALPTVALELASRFACDALLECYFGWNKQKYRAAWQHNLVRATSQLNLAKSYVTQQHAVVEVLQQVLV